MKQTLLLTLLLLALSCQNNNTNNSTNKQTDMPKSKQQQLENLMDSLTNVTNAETEGKILDKIWQYTHAAKLEMEAGTEPILFSALMSVTDSLGHQVANNLSTAKGKVKVDLTVSNDKDWSKTISFTPIEKDNLYLLMRE